MNVSNKKSILSGCISNSSMPSFMLTFKASVDNDPTKDAIIFEDDSGKINSISYKFLDSQSNRIARVLRRLTSKSFGKNIVIVALELSEYLPIFLLSILKAGFSYLPIDVEYPSQRINYILKEARPVLCILGKNVDEEPFNDFSKLSADELIASANLEADVLSYSIDESQVALTLYTSGSTGFPKGVQLQFTALMNRLEWQWKEFPYASNENFCILKTAITFVDSVCEIWGPLLKSRTLVIVPRYFTKNPEMLIATLDKYMIQRIVLVPSLLKSIMVYLRFKEDKQNLTELNLWICSGESLSVSLVNEFFDWFNNEDKIIANFYGSTEVMGDVTFHAIKKKNFIPDERTTPIGKPIDNCIVYLVDNDLNLVTQGSIGEILIAGKNLAYGYVSDNKLHKFIENPFSSNSDFKKVFKTGDLAKISNDVIFYEGRQDNQVKIRGQKVDLSEIERAALDIPFVKEAVAVFLNLDESNETILCFIVPKQNFIQQCEDEVVSQLKKTLLSYMIPKVIIQQEIPLLINGKVDRQKLLEIYTLANNNRNEKNQDYNYSHVPNEYLTEAKILFPLLTSILDIQNENINMESSFYEQGGNSLNSIYTISKLRKQGFEIGITDFINAQSIKEILLKMKNGKFTNDDENNANQYILEMLNDSHKNEVIKMITESFLAKADLERWLLSEIEKEDYAYFINCLWKDLVIKNYSFVLKSYVDQTIMSVALNFDARDEPSIVIKSKLNVIFEFLEFLEKPVRDVHLPPGKNKIFHTFMMATNNKLNSAQNVILMRVMEQKCLEIAEKNHFIGILTTNTSPLTQQLGKDIFHYETMLDYQINQYITPEGFKPFEKAPNHQRAIVAWKKLSNEM